MDIDDIYASFCNQRTDAKQSPLELHRDAVMEQIRALGATEKELLAIESQVNALCVAQEEEAFKDGFCVGINHITKAMAYANARLCR